MSCRPMGKVESFLRVSGGAYRREICVCPRKQRRGRLGKRDGFYLTTSAPLWLLAALIDRRSGCVNGGSGLS